MNNEQSLITVKQLPIIEQTLDMISTKIDFEIKEAKNLVPTDPNKVTAHLKKSELI